MIKSKEELDKVLTKESKRILFDRKRYEEAVHNINEKYNIPTGMIADMISHRMELTNASEFMLYTLLDEVAKQYNKRIVRSIFWTSTLSS